MYKDQLASGETNWNKAGGSPPAATVHRRPWWRRILAEPLTHFVVVGIAIFLVAHALERSSTRYQITITPDDVARIVNSYAQQYGAPPTPQQTRVMIDNYVREEIFYREGVALGIDRNDEIVRRRVAQKYEFLQQDLAAPRDPDDATLRRYFAAHQAAYIVPERRSFDQIYVAMDSRGEAAAQALADATLADLKTGRPARFAGDEFPGPKVIESLSRADTERLFGGDAFARSVFAAPRGVWSGPYRSGFGWHLIRVTRVTPPAARGFAAARADVLIDWREADRAARNAKSFAALRARYTVDRADLNP